MEQTPAKTEKKSAGESVKNLFKNIKNRLARLGVQREPFVCRGVVSSG